MSEDKEFTLEEILEEQRRAREQQPAAQDKPEPQKAAPLERTEKPTSPQRTGRQQPAPKPTPQEQAASTPEWGDGLKPQETMRDRQYKDGAPEEPEDSADLNAYATGSFDAPEEEMAEEPEESPKKKKKKKGGLFGRKKKMPDYDDGEDMYYGIQLKPIDEYRRGFDPATGEITLEQDAFKSLFDNSQTAIDDEVEKNFETLQRERRRRVAQAVQNAGVDEDQIADEFGIVAPMPVTAFAADPYARQHGIEVETGAGGKEELPEIQKAMMETSTDKTMEIKLNVLNDTVEIQRVKEMPAVSEDTVTRILDSAEALREDAEQPAYREPAYVEPEYVEQNYKDSDSPLEEVREDTEPEHLQQAEEEEPETVREYVPKADRESNRPSAVSENPSAPQETVIIGSRGLGEIPQIASIYEYRERSIPTHVINADILQSALLSESEEILKDTEEKAAPMFRRRLRAKKPELQIEEQEEDLSGESIDDYTGPEDAKSISSELRGDMRELTLRMMITGVCTVLLGVTNLFFGGMATVYVVLNIVFLGIAVGVCYRTVLNGLRSLFALNANSDSAAAAACVAVGLQTVASLFFSSDLAEGKLHLYGVLLSAVLFVNAVGKLMMIRRIHSNFRFVTSREQKYSVQLYDDYNTALKMTKDCVAEKPLIAYQNKTGFLKRFLEFSYSADPAEAASQLLAPIGLVASLVLCIVTLLITKNVPSALSALAAASCVCVAAGNMLAVNLPVNRLCKAARRAGAMVAGYEAVEKFGGVNAVMADAGEIFPLGTVVLNGIRTFGNSMSAEESVMAASALMKEIGGPLYGVFQQVISENEESLPKVENVSYEDEHGVVGTVDGRRIYIGNRALLVNHRIEPPSREDEMQYASGNKQVVYIAVENTLAALLVVTYSADRRRKNELQRMEDSGISVLVRTTDANITAQMISRLFDIDVASVGILSGRLGEVEQELTGEETPRADALVATKGRMESMLSVVSACVREKRGVGVIVAMQNAAVVLGFVLVAFMACFGGMKQLSVLILFLFELFWLVIILLVPKLRK